MRFDSPDNEHVVSFGCESVEMHGHAVGSLRDNSSFHGRSNWDFDEFFRDAKTGQHLDLAFGGSSAMVPIAGTRNGAAPIDVK